MSTLRSWATPLTIGSFIISTVTGIVLFFHWNLGLAKPAHEWLSWFMVLGVGLHLAVNWRAFKNYFTKPIPLIVMGLFSVLTVASLLPLNIGAGKPPQAKALDALQTAPIGALAAVQQKPIETILKNLQAAGIEVTDPNQTLPQVAQTSQKSERQLLGIIFQ
jgi:hypothetical protein